jgi:hypothetical protein
MSVSLRTGQYQEAPVPAVRVPLGTHAHTPASPGSLAGGVLCLAGVALSRRRPATALQRRRTRELTDEGIHG